MARDGRPPAWTTLLVVAGTLVVVALVLYSVGDRTPQDVEPAATATSSAEPTGSPVPSPERPQATTTPAPTSSAAPTISPTDQTVDLEVLNQTGLDGLAGRAGEAIEAAGWPVSRVDSASLGAPSSTLYVPDGLSEEAEEFLGRFPAVSRTRPAFEGLTPGVLTLVLAEPDAAEIVLALEQQTPQT